KSIPMSDEMTDIFEQQRQKFVDKYGREPGPNDPVFFDLPPLEQIEFQTVQAMQKAGIDPAVIYAYEKTGGLLVTEQNKHLISDRDLAQWQAAIEEYQEKHSTERPRKRKGDETGQPRFAIGTGAFYGPDDKRTTKIAAAVIPQGGAEPVLKRWVATDVTTNPKVQQELKDFFLQHGVQQVAMSQGNLGCPHEEGEDFPVGEDCPFCPFWKGK